MNLNQIVTITYGGKKLDIPLKNILKFAFVHFTKLRSEFHMIQGESNIARFWEFVENSLDIHEGDVILK